MIINKSNFTYKKISSEETLGDILKKSRERNHLSLEEVSRKTKIRKTYLEALENNDFSSLPYEPYAKGILKKYLNILNLDEKEIIKIYQRQKGLEEHIKGNIRRPVSYSLKSPRVIIGPKIYFIIFIILIFLGFASYIIYQAQRLIKPPEIIINYPPDNFVTKSESISIEGKTDVEADIFINDQSIPVDENGQFKSNINLQKGINYIKITAKNRINKEKTIIKQVLADFKEKKVQNNIPANSSLQLTIKVNPNSAWLYIEADNQEIYSGIMLPGTEKSFTAKEYITLTTRNAGSIEIIFNGKNKGKLGKEGEIIRGLRFDKNTKIN